MDHLHPRDTEISVDIERGIISGDEVEITSVDMSVNGEKLVKLSVNSSDSDEVSPEKLKLLIDKRVEGEKCGDFTEKKMGKEKRKKTSAKKPPRPPRGLSLDAADEKLIKEIAELAMIKQARIERMKALKKMKAAKVSSSNGSLFVMLFTVLFCLVIFFQGVSSRSSAISFQGSPETDNGFVLVQDHLNPSASVTNLSRSNSLTLAEQVSGSDSTSKASRATG